MGMMAMSGLLLCGALVTQAHAGDALKIGGDVRFRYEMDQRTTPKDGEDDEVKLRERARLRARIGATYKTPVDGVSLGIRLSTNPGTPGNSPHQTMGMNIDSAGKDAANVMMLDRAYIKWSLGHGATLVLGKQAYPHWKQAVSALPLRSLVCR